MDDALFTKFSLTNGRLFMGDILYVCNPIKLPEFYTLKMF